MVQPESSKTAKPSAPRGNGDEVLVRPDELRRIAEEMERAAASQALAHVKLHETEQQDLYRAFNERHLQPEAGKRFSELVRKAAEHGERRVEVLRFPSDWCTDRGRAINNAEPDWPDTLTGLAKEGYEAYDKRLRPLGYKMQAQILDYPGGMPGDVGLFISW